MKSLRNLYRIGYGPSSSHTMGPQKAAQYMLDKYKEAGSVGEALYLDVCAAVKQADSEIRVSGGIYGNGLLTFNEEDDPAYIEECKEAYKAWEPNPHMRFNNELLVSLTRWLLAVSDMGGYLNLNAVDKLTFIDNKDIMNEYRNLDDLVWTSDDVDHAMDTTCYWFMFTGDDGNGEFAPIEKCLGWEKGSMFGIIRDNDGYYHILNFKRSNQFSITMPLKRTQGQSCRLP